MERQLLDKGQGVRFKKLDYLMSGWDDLTDGKVYIVVASLYRDYDTCFAIVNDEDEVVPISYDWIDSAFFKTKVSSYKQRKKYEVRKG